MSGVVEGWTSSSSSSSSSALSVMLLQQLALHSLTSTIDFSLPSSSTSVSSPSQSAAASSSRGGPASTFTSGSDFSFKPEVVDSWSSLSQWDSLSPLHQGVVVSEVAPHVSRRRYASTRRRPISTTSSLSPASVLPGAWKDPAPGRSRDCGGGSGGG